MLSFLQEKISVPASFVSSTLSGGLYATINQATQLYSDYYQPVAPYLAKFSTFKQGLNIALKGGELSEWGNFALSILAFPGVSKEIAASVESATGIDKATVEFYIDTSVTCLSLAATILPKISEYLKKNKEKLSAADAQQLEENIEILVVKMENILEDVPEEMQPHIQSKSQLLFKFNEKEAQEEAPSNPVTSKIRRD